jgi:hypothetical protein
MTTRCQIESCPNPVETGFVDPDSKAEMAVCQFHAIALAGGERWTRVEGGVIRLSNAMPQELLTSQLHELVRAPRVDLVLTVGRDGIEEDTVTFTVNEETAGALADLIRARYPRDA